jgi:hypothetical protein
MRKRVKSVEKIVTYKGKIIIVRMGEKIHRKSVPNLNPNPQN